jgi:hypothetical protein
MTGVMTPIRLRSQNRPHGLLAGDQEDTSGQYDGIPWDVYFAGYTPGDPWEVEAADTVILNGVYTGYGDGTISGHLRVQPGPGTVGLQATKMHWEDGGSFKIGNRGADARFTGTGYFEGNGLPSVSPDDHDRGIMQHGNFEFDEFSTELENTWLKVVGHVAVGATSLTLEAADPTWKVGHKIVLGVTTKYGYGPPEERILTDVSGAVLSWTTPLERSYWGIMMYVTDTGISDTPGTFTPPHPDVPDTVDQICRVMNMSGRCWEFRGADDDEWADNKFGLHIMLMSLDCRFRTTSTKWLRCGQQGLQRRYPLHLHVLSYAIVSGKVTNTFLGALEAGQIRVYKSAFEDCFNRCMVFHSTHGAEAVQNTVYNIRGHAFFFEDACEEGNTVTNNCGMVIKGQPSGKILPIGGANELERAADSAGEQGASLVWLTNPFNDVNENYVCAAEGGCVWQAYPEGALGISGVTPLGTQAVEDDYVDIAPNYRPFGDIRDNYAIGCMGSGNLLRGAPIDAAGNTSLSVRYLPSDTGLPGGDPVMFAPHVLRFQAHHCYEGDWRNRTNVPRYGSFTGSDNLAAYNNGSTSDTFGQDADIFGVIENSLHVYESLNNAGAARPAPLPGDWETGGLPVFNFSYHSSLAYVNNVNVGAKKTTGVDSLGRTQFSGVWTFGDQYVRPYEAGWARNIGNVYIPQDAEPCYLGGRMLSPDPDGDEPPLGWFCLADVIDNSGGVFGDDGEVNVYNVPRLTVGADATYDVMNDNGNSIMADGAYIGFNAFNNSEASSPFTLGLEITRYDDSDVMVGDPKVIPYTDFDGGNKNFSIFRHFGMLMGVPGYTVVEYLDAAPEGDWFSCTVDRLHFHTGITAVVAFPLDQTAAIAEVFYTAWYLGNTGAGRRDCALAADLDEVMADTTGAKYWPDPTNKLVYMSMKGGLTYYGTPDPQSDIGLLMPYKIALRCVGASIPGYGP